MQNSGTHPNLHSFPTRRSSDLKAAYFIEHGLGSVVAINNGRQAEIAIVGWEGMTGLSVVLGAERSPHETFIDRKSTRLNSSHLGISYAVFCLKKKTRRQSKTSA